VQVTPIGSASVPARLVARDETNDLALLKTDIAAPMVPSFRSGAKVGESISAYGFPLAGLLATSGNFTVGNITAAAGLRDDSRMLQISAPVQVGNSGGPLLDGSGNIVGVIVGKLNAIEVAAVARDLAQNVNFAIKSAVAVNFLETNGV